MLTEERQNYILDCLKTKEIVKLQDLVTHTKASETTVRRDLQELEDKGLLTRIHGGAKRTRGLVDEPSQIVKSGENQSEKRKIGALAVSRLHKNDVIFLDAGTTTQAMIPFLSDSANNLNLTIVTNSVDNAEMLAEINQKVFLIGGQVRNLTKAVIGSKAIDQLTNYRFDIAFLGTNGIDLKNGYSTPDPEEAAIKSLVLSQAHQIYVLADHTKFGQVSFDRFAKLDQAAIITSQVPKEFQNLFHQTTIEEATNQ